MWVVNDQDVRIDGQKRNGIVRRASINSHNWVGAIVNLKTQANDKFAYQLGFDLRKYRGIHYRRLDNLLGADAYRGFDNVNKPNGNLVSTEYSSDLGALWNVFKSTDDEVKLITITMV